MRTRVVLPDPLGPTSPTRSPGLSWNEASTKSTCRPYCLLMREKAIMGKWPLHLRDVVPVHDRVEDHVELRVVLPAVDRIVREEQHAALAVVGIRDVDRERLLSQ